MPNSKTRKAAAPQPAAETSAAPAKTPRASSAKSSTKSDAKPITKAASKPVTKPAAKPAAKLATQAAAPAKRSRAATPPSAAAATPAEKKPAKARVKLVRDGFTMPEGDFALIGTLKQRALAVQREVKKSELLRAGLRVLAALDAKALLAALAQLEPVKTGRPKKGH